MEELVPFLIIIIKIFIKNKYLPESGDNCIKRNVKSSKWEEKFAE